MVMLRQLLVLLPLLACVAAAENAYCKICKDHPLCKYTTTPGAACKNYVAPRMSSSDKELIVRLHNEFRNKVALGQEKRGKGNPQPSASNMRKMSWDDELATIAQRWADQCIFEHSTCMSTRDGTDAGQNLLSGGIAPGQVTPDWKAAVTIWYDEVALRDGSKNTQPFTVDETFENIGHYTQVAWAETYAVGCGYSSYRAGSGNKPDTQLVVCNYKPSGNYGGEVVPGRRSSIEVPPGHQEGFYLQGVVCLATLEHCQTLRLNKTIRSVFICKFFTDYLKVYTCV
ncbi:venom allergen 3 homolog [Frankliniella occidentalis]|uniref:Venom allergen 3 homolog n=1 Tax=Frankliniella occidentalis TaxID=133901 RepID=A0A6J1S1X9_FRAOC|nr:venom allergen 3 homolog [Frankliniella occidentalis]